MIENLNQQKRSIPEYSLDDNLTKNELYKIRFRSLINRLENCIRTLEIGRSQKEEEKKQSSKDKIHRGSIFSEEKDQSLNIKKKIPLKNSSRMKKENDPFLIEFFQKLIDRNYLKEKQWFLNYYKTLTPEQKPTAIRKFLTINKIFIKNITILNLSNANLTRLPPEIKAFRNLQYLYIDNNSLTSLPDELKDLKNLRELDIRNNLFDHPLPILCQLNLKTLYH